MDPKEILEKQKLDELPDRIRIFFERMLVPKDTLQLVLEAKSRGIDLDRILKEMLYPSASAKSYL
jgi:hypothetical protein